MRVQCVLVCVQCWSLYHVLMLCCHLRSHVGLVPDNVLLLVCVCVCVCVCCLQVQKLIRCHLKPHIVVVFVELAFQVGGAEEEGQRRRGRVGGAEEKGRSGRGRGGEGGEPGAEWEGKGEEGGAEWEGQGGGKEQGQFREM